MTDEAAHSRSGSVRGRFLTISSHRGCKTLGVLVATVGRPAGQNTIVEHRESLRMISGFDE
jgi:hypothetical protein